jgi:hypothetical protein
MNMRSEGERPTMLKSSHSSAIKMSNLRLNTNLGMGNDQLNQSISPANQTNSFIDKNYGGAGGGMNRSAMIDSSYDNNYGPN